MKESREHELLLRAAALDTSKDGRVDRKAAIAILADFYEQNGQPSRAALWRELLSPRAAAGKKPISGSGEPYPRARRHVLQEVPDLLTRPHQPQATDSRRNQMIWLLRTQGLSSRKTAAAFDLSSTRVEQIVAVEDRLIGMHVRNEQLRPTLKATERLVAAGALPGERPTRHGYQEPWFELGVELPEDWPAEHQRCTTAVEPKTKNKRRGKQ